MEDTDITFSEGAMYWKGFLITYPKGIGKKGYYFANLHRLPKKYSSRVFPSRTISMILEDGTLQVPCWIWPSFFSPETTVEKMTKFVSLAEKAALEKIPLTEEELEFLLLFQATHDKEVFLEMKPRPLNFGFPPRRRNPTPEVKQEMENIVRQLLGEN